MYEKIKKAIIDKVLGSSFRISDYEKIVNFAKAKPNENILSYLRERFPNEEAAFIAWIFDRYNDDKIFFSEDLKLLAHRISNIKFENGILGKEIIKRKILNPTKLRMLGL